MKEQSISLSTQNYRPMNFDRESQLLNKPSGTPHPGTLIRACPPVTAMVAPTAASPSFPGNEPPASRGSRLVENCNLLRLIYLTHICYPQTQTYTHTTFDFSTQPTSISLPSRLLSNNLMHNLLQPPTTSYKSLKRTSCALPIMKKLQLAFSTCIGRPITHRRMCQQCS